DLSAGVHQRAHHGGLRVGADCGGRIVGANDGMGHVVRLSSLSFSLTLPTDRRNHPVSRHGFEGMERRYRGSTRCLPPMALPKVMRSANSSSPPCGTPLAIRLMVMPCAPNSCANNRAVASP